MRLNTLLVREFSIRIRIKTNLSLHQPSQKFMSEGIPLKQGFAALEEKMNTHNQDTTPQKREYKKTK